MMMSLHCLMWSRKLWVLLRIRHCGALMAQEKYLFSKTWPEKKNCFHECEKDKYFYLCIRPRETVQPFYSLYIYIYIYIYIYRQFLIEKSWYREKQVFTLKISVIMVQYTINRSAILTCRQIARKLVYFRHYLAAYYNTYSHWVDFLASRIWIILWLAHTEWTLCWIQWLLLELQ